MTNTLLNYTSRTARLLQTFLIATVMYGSALAEPANETAVEVAFMFNFFKYIEWPESANKKNTLSFCTTENDQFGSNLLALESKTVNNKFLVIRRGIRGKELKNCHMVFIASAVNAASVISDLKGLPIVTVSEEENFIDEGGIIGFVQNDNHLGFEINLARANIEGLQISSQILKLAKRVNVEK